MHCWPDHTWAAACQGFFSGSFTMVDSEIGHNFDDVTGMLSATLSCCLPMLLGRLLTCTALLQTSTVPPTLPSGSARLGNSSCMMWRTTRWSQAAS